MRRPGILLCLVLLLTVAARLGSPPTYVGAPDEERTPWWNAVSAPFGDDLRGSCNAFLSFLAQSLRREGLAATGGIPVLNMGPAEPEQYWYYDHHTPGVPLVTALAFELGGRSERTARLVALCFSTLTTLVLMLLVLREWGLAAATVAGIAHGFLPLGLYWGTHLNFEVPTVPFLLLFLATALRERPSYGRAALWLALAFLMDVVALFGVAAVALEVLGRRRPKDLLPLAGMAVALVVAWLAWRGLQTARHGHTTASSLQEHLLHSTMLSPAFDLRTWGDGVLCALLLLGGGWPVALLLFELWMSVRQPAASRLDRLFRATLVVAVLNVVVPAIQATTHEYYALYFQLPLALACARFARRLWHGARRWPGLGPGLAAALGLALVVHGIWLDRQRPSPSLSFPSAHRLGRELQGLAEGRSGVLLLPAPEPGGPTWQLMTVVWYAGRPVLEAQPGDPEGQGLKGQLAAQGLGDQPLLRAEPRQWPGRDGLVELPPP